MESQQEAFKQSVIKTFPTNINEVLFIYNNFGKVLFKDDWDDSSKPFKMFDTSTEECTGVIVGYLKCTEHFTLEEKNEAYNFIFSYSLKYLSENVSSLTLLNKEK